MQGEYIVITFRSSHVMPLAHIAKPSKPSSGRLFQAIERSTKPTYEVRSNINMNPSGCARYTSSCNSQCRKKLLISS